MNRRTFISTTGYALLGAPGLWGQRCEVPQPEWSQNLPTENKDVPVSERSYGLCISPRQNPILAMPPEGCCPCPAAAGLSNLSDCIAFRPAKRRPLPRRLWSTIDPDKDGQLLKDLSDAYHILRGRRQDDPTSLIRQAWLHDFYCGGKWGGGDVHSTWAFLPWHRAFIYFHETILADAISKPKFRLPVWDWENNGKIPQFFEDIGLPTFLIGTAGRWPDLSQDWTSPTAVQAWFLSNSFQDFCGSAPCSQDPCAAAPPQPGKPCTPPPPGKAFGGVHGSVHAKLVGGAMRASSTAAADPIFYAHHANIDRFWWHWLKVHKELPIPEEFSKQAFYFYDEKRRLVRVEAGQLLNEADLGYRYDHQPSVKCFSYESLPLRQNHLSDANSTQLEMRKLTVGALLSTGKRSLTEICGFLRDPKTDYRKLLTSASGFTSLPVQIRVSVGTENLEPGEYYMVLLSNPSGTYPVGGFAVFASAEHLKMHDSFSIVIAGRIEPDLFRALLHSVGSFKLIYGKLDRGATLPSETWPISDPLLQVNILHPDGDYRAGEKYLDQFRLFRLL